MKTTTHTIALLFSITFTLVGMSGCAAAVDSSAPEGASAESENSSTGDEVTTIRRDEHMRPMAGTEGHRDAVSHVTAEERSTGGASHPGPIPHRAE